MEMVPFASSSTDVHPEFVPPVDLGPYVTLGRGEEESFALGPYVDESRRRGEAKFQIHNPNSPSYSDKFKYVPNRVIDKLYRIQNNDPTLTQAKFSNDVTIIDIERNDFPMFLKGTHNTHLKVLDLSMLNLFGMRNRYHIFTMFANLIALDEIRIEKLNLHGNGTIKEWEVYTPLLNIINHSTTLTDLDLSGCGIVTHMYVHKPGDDDDDEEPEKTFDINLFPKVIARNTTLKRLDLSHFTLDNEATGVVMKLFKALVEGRIRDDKPKRPRVIEELSIYIALIDLTPDLFNMMRSLITDVPSFKRLFWSSDEMPENADFIHFCQALEETKTLETFSFPGIYDDLSDDERDQIFSRITNNVHRPFKQLSLSYQTFATIPGKSFNNLLKGLSRRSTAPNRLRKLETDYVHFDEDSHKAVELFLRSTPKLSDLSLEQDTVFDDENESREYGSLIVSVIASNLTYVSRLIILEFRQFIMNPKAMTDLFTAMQTNQTIQSLIINFPQENVHNSTAEEIGHVRHAVLEFVKENKSVTLLNVRDNDYVKMFIDEFVVYLETYNNTLMDIDYSHYLPQPMEEGFGEAQAKLINILTRILAVKQRNRHNLDIKANDISTLSWNYYMSIFGQSDILESYQFILPSDIVSMYAMIHDVTSNNAPMVVYTQRLSEFLNLKVWRTGAENDRPIIGGDFSPNDVIRAVKRNDENMDKYEPYFSLLKGAAEPGQTDPVYGTHGTLTYHRYNNDYIIVRWPSDCDLPIYIYSGLGNLASAVLSGANLVYIYIVSEDQLKEHTSVPGASLAPMIPTSSSMTEEEQYAKRHRGDAKFFIESYEFGKPVGDYKYIQSGVLDTLYRIRNNDPTLKSADFQNSSFIKTCDTNDLREILNGTYNTYLEELNLSYLEFFSQSDMFEKFEVFAELIIQGRLKIRKLNLSANDRIKPKTEKTLKLLCDIILKTTTIEDLNLSYCGIINHVETIGYFADAIRQNKTIKIWRLNAFTAASYTWRYILGALMRYNKIEMPDGKTIRVYILEKLSIVNVEIEEKTFEALYYLMVKIQTMTSLDISGSILMTNDLNTGFHWFTRALTETRHLKTLRMSRCQFHGTTGAQVISAMEQNTQPPYHTLDVSSCYFSADLMNRLLTKLNTHREGPVRGFVLRKLLILSNNFDKNSAILLYNLLSNESLPLQVFDISQLDSLSSGRVDNEIMRQLVRGLIENQNTKLKEVSIVDFKFTEYQTFIDLFDFIRTNTTIQVFYYSSSSRVRTVLSQGIEVFLDFLEHNQTVKSFHMERPYFDYHLVDQLRSAISKNKSLTDIVMHITSRDQDHEEHDEDLEDARGYLAVTLRNTERRNKLRQKRSMMSLKAAVMTTANEQLMEMTMKSFTPITNDDLRSLNDLESMVKTNNPLMAVSIKKFDYLLNLPFVRTKDERVISMREAALDMEKNKHSEFNTILTSALAQGYSLSSEHGQYGRILTLSHGYKPIIVRWPVECAGPIYVYTLSAIGFLMLNLFFKANIVYLYIVTEEQLRNLTFPPLELNYAKPSSSSSSSSSSSQTHEKTSKTKRKRTGARRKM